MRLDVVSVPAEQSLPDYLKSGWMEKVDPASVEEFTVNGFPAATATANGDEWSFRLFAVRFGSDVYRFIFAAKNRTRASRPLVPRVDRNLPPHEPARKARRCIRCASRSSPSAPTIRWRRWRAAWRPPIIRSTASACINGLGPHDTVKPGDEGEDRGGVIFCRPGRSA